MGFRPAPLAQLNLVYFDLIDSVSKSDQIVSIRFNIRLASRARFPPLDPRDVEVRVVPLPAGLGAPFWCALLFVLVLADDWRSLFDLGIDGSGN